jgi:hypothetical protein
MPAICEKLNYFHVFSNEGLKSNFKGTTEHHSYSKFGVATIAIAPPIGKFT